MNYSSRLLKKREEEEKKESQISHARFVGLSNALQPCSATLSSRLSKLPGVAVDSFLLPLYATIPILIFYSFLQFFLLLLPSLVNGCLMYIQSVCSTAFSRFFTFPPCRVIMTYSLFNAAPLPEWLLIAQVVKSSSICGIPLLVTSRWVLMDGINAATLLRSRARARSYQSMAAPSQRICGCVPHTTSPLDSSPQYTKTTIENFLLYPPQTNDKRILLPPTASPSSITFNGL